MWINGCVSEEKNAGVHSTTMVGPLCSFDVEFVSKFKDKNGDANVK